MATSQPPSGGPPEPSAPEEAAKQPNWWKRICIVLGILAVGLLVWAVVAQSDLNSTQDDLDSLQAQVDQNEETGSTVVAASKALYEDIKAQLGLTNEDLAETEADLADAEKDAEQAEKDAAEAKQDAEDAKSDTDKAKAEADQAQAEKEAADSKTAVAADCAKAYVSAFGKLFEGDSADAVGKQLESISEQCKAAMAKL